MDDLMLLRLPIVDGPWAEGLPPVPDGFQVTLVFHSVTDAAIHAQATGVLGYTVADILEEDNPSAPVADFLLEKRLVESFPRWRDTLIERGAKVFDLSLGPSRMIMRRFIEPHLFIWQNETYEE